MAAIVYHPQPDRAGLTDGEKPQYPVETGWRVKPGFGHQPAFAILSIYFQTAFIRQSNWMPAYKFLKKVAHFQGKP